MKGMTIYEGLTHIDDTFILGSMPSAASPAAKAPRFGVLPRFLSSGVGAAVISGVVAVGVLVAIVLAGRNTPSLPPVTTDNPPPVTESTEEESGHETEDVTEDTVIDTPEEAEARKDELITILDALDYKWNILADPSYYFDQYAPVKEFGVYGVPYMLDYIMEHEGETDAEELKRLGVILHFAYHNLGVTDTSGWHRPDPYSLDLFDNTKCLMEHLEEYGLRVNTRLMSTQNQPDDALASDIRTYLDSFVVSDSMLMSANYRGIPASVINATGFDQISSFGIEAIPDILAYTKGLVANLDCSHIYGDYDICEGDILASKGFFFLACSYEMLNAPSMYDWIHPNVSDVNLLYHPLTWLNELEAFITKNGLRPIYPFLSAEEAMANQDKITRQLENACYFGWGLTRNLSDYQTDASLVTVFGSYAVPYVLDYILSHEGQPLTPDEEMNLGVLLHCAYRMLGVETTAEWHMPAEPVASTTDPFPYARELTAHLGEYGLEPVP